LFHFGFESAMGNILTCQFIDISSLPLKCGGCGGGLPPHEESSNEAEVDHKEFPKVMSGAVAPKGCLLTQTDIGVAQLVNSQKGLQLPWTIVLWHWGMVVAAGLIFGAVFFATTPIVADTDANATGLLLDRVGLPAAFPWQTLAQKLMIFWYMWEALGLGVIHGPMHAKFNPPFQDWWYRFTPGTLKYRAPFLPKCKLLDERNYLDILVESIITYGLVIYLLCKPSISHKDIWPLFACSVYEFIFDYGQHLHTYGTQTMHVFACMCFPIAQGQLVGIQIFLTWFYACSGFCKIGPCFKYLNVANLMTAKYMVSTPWAKCYRRLMFKKAEPEKAEDADYNLTCVAAIFSFICAMLETAGPALCFLHGGQDTTILLGLALFLSMHIYIVSSLIVDVFTWNFVDAVYYVVMFGVLRTGFDWHAVATMHPYLMAWLGLHALYAIYGNFFPNQVPYIVAHRHAAGNFSQGMIFIKFEALEKLMGFTQKYAHPGLPSAMDPMNANGMKWLGQWLAVHALIAYFWLWNMPSRMLVPVMQSWLNCQGRKYNDYVMIHSVLLFDALCAHVRFDGLSSVQMIEVLGERCGFEDGDCTLCWVGAFQAFPIQGCCDAKASWKIIDSKKGVLKEGQMSISDCENAKYKKPSDCEELVQKVTDTPLRGSEGQGIKEPFMKPNIPVEADRAQQ